MSGAAGACADDLSGYWQVEADDAILIEQNSLLAGARGGGNCSEQKASSALCELPRPDIGDAGAHRHV